MKCWNTLKPLYSCCDILDISVSFNDDEQVEDITMGNQQARQEDNLIEVPSMEGYFVDVVGNIYSTKQRSVPNMLTQSEHFGKSRNPYLRVKMGGRLFLAHRIVLSAKIGRPLLSNEFVNHLNGNTKDNNFDNLEVVSHKENTEHAVANGLYCSGDAWYKARGIVKKSCKPQRLSKTATQLVE